MSPLWRGFLRGLDLRPSANKYAYGLWAAFAVYFVVLALLLFGCSPPIVPDYPPDRHGVITYQLEGANPDEAKTVARAARVWLPAGLEVREGYGGDAHVVVIVGGSLDKDTCGVSSWEWALGWRRTVVLPRPSKPGCDLYRAAAHEFGHMIGLPHHPRLKMGVMSVSSWGEGLSDADLELVCRVTGRCAEVK